MVSMDKVQMGIAKFVDSELLPQFHVDSQLKAFGVKVFATLAVSKSGEMISRLAENPMLAALNVITPEGVDVDALKAAADGAFPPGGLEFEIPFIEKKIRFHREDVDLLYRKIMEG